MLNGRKYQIISYRLTDLASGVTGERVSRISLVDLAGSERALKTGIQYIEHQDHNKKSNLLIFHLKKLVYNFAVGQK